MKRIRRLFNKTITYNRLTENCSSTSFGNIAMSTNNNNNNNNAEQPKKSNSVFGKLGQTFSTIKDIAQDIAQDVERRKQLHNQANNNQIHFTRTNELEDSLVIETKPPTPNEVQQRRSSGDDSTISERSFSFSQMTTNLGKKLMNDSSSEKTSSRSIQDLCATENAEQAKEMLMHNLREELKRRRTVSDSSTEDLTMNITDPSHLKAVTKEEKNQRKPTMLLAGPKFRYHTAESIYDPKRDTIYPISIGVGIISTIIFFWRPISPFLSGYFLGFLCAASISYVIIQMYLKTKTNTIIAHEWIDFPDLTSIIDEKDKHISLNTCCEIVFGRYDIDHDNEFIRYPAVIRLDNYNLYIQLPHKTKSDDNNKKEKELKFIGYKKYSIQDAKLTLVPEGTLTRIKYWLDEYPIVLQNLEISDKQIINKQFYEKTKFDPEEFFNNSQTTISVFFETGPEKEEWFHRLSLVLRKAKEEIPHSISHSASDTQISTLSSRTTNLENRVQMKKTETVGPPYTDTTSINKSDTEILRSQINEGDIISDMTQARIGAQELRNETGDKDSDKDSINTNRSTTSKKKLRKEEENLYHLLGSPDCLDEAAITINFLIRRLFCDVFQERLFKDLLKEKIEHKLKEIAVSVIEDLRVETIDMGNTFPVILKVEPMQWNPKGLWFNLFLFYRGSFKITMKTRIVLQRLLNYNPLCDQPMHYQHHSDQLVHKTDERTEHDDSVQRQKTSSKEADIPENAAARKLGALLNKVASNKHVQRIAAFKPVAGYIEKLSNAEIGANIELLNISGRMTINIPPPPSDRIWIGFAEMPDLNLKVTPLFGENKYSYTLIHDFLEARIRDEIKRLLVLPAMDDTLLPFFRDWVTDVIGESATKSSNKDLNQTNSEEI